MSHTFGLSPGLMLGMMLALATPAPTLAQAMVQPIPGTTDADRLGEQMRALAVNANDVNALITAGELSLKLDDLTAAASLFARAEKVDPRNPRLRAGEASVLVRSERPGEALRYFAQAQAMGLDPARFASDRGLAYDLIGEQERAQRDYRLALRNGADEEVTRRYALSLGISGKRDLALEQLDPLLRETDRGAWRARAFVLAMAGDVSGAERIATTMMPPGMAEGLQPFFQRLPSLPAIDRAFAVHFGEVRATSDRLADARLAPAMAALGPDPYAPATVARAPVAVAEQQDKPDKKRKKDRQKAARVELAAAVLPTRSALPPPPAYTGQPVTVYEPAPRPSAPMSATARANAQQLATIRADMYPTRAASTSTSTDSRAGRTVTLASATRTMSAPSAPVQTRLAAAPMATIQPLPTRPPMQTAMAESVPTPSPAKTAPLQAPPPRSAPEEARSPAPVPGFSSTPTTAPVASAPVQVASTPIAVTPTAAMTPTPASAPVAVAESTPAPAPVAVAEVTSVPAPPDQIAAVTPADVSSTPAPIVAATARVFATSEPAATVPAAAPRPEPALPVTGARDSADTILARIIAGLSIPESELAVLPIRASKTPATNVVAQAKAKEARDAAAEKLVVSKQAADKQAADKLAADKKKAALDKKALAAKKIADDKKAADAKAAVEAKKLARANPARTWVQVAGGANEGDLPKAFAAVKAKAPTVFAGRSGWSTPLRATNRVLVGPFKTDADARAFVNALAKAGVSGFTFTSDEGQQVTRLPAK